jgi:hypothetical protein
MLLGGVPVSKIRRKDLILYLLYANNKQPVSGRTRLQKLIFLLEKDKKIATHLTSNFGFKAWKYGPFSDDLFRDIEFLENVSLVESRSAGLPAEAERGEQGALDSDYMDDTAEFSADQMYVLQDFSLTPQGERFVVERIEPKLPPGIKLAVQSAKKEYNRLNLGNLLRFVYSKYPRYAVKSELRHYR